MKTTERLLSATKEIWDAYNEHPFVLGIQDGTLDREKFKYYIIQDYLYLEEYAKVFAVGIAKAKSPETFQLFSKYVTLIEKELNIHRIYMGQAAKVQEAPDGTPDVHCGYIDRFAISKKDLETTPRSLDNLSYTSYMLRVAYEEGEAEILAAILSCAYSYEVIARTIVERNPSAVSHPFYGEWIKGYTDPGYCGANALLMDMMERVTEHYTEVQLRHLTDIFTACSRYELAFWELAWNMSK